MKRNFIFLAGSLLMVATLTGCGLSSKQIIKTQSFGAATERIGKLGEKEFIAIRNGIIEMNKVLIAIDNTKNSSDLKFDRPTSTQATATRIAATKALKSYGELLVILSSEDRTNHLQKTANSLLDNTSVALNRELSDNQKQTLNKVLVGFGSLWISQKKAEAAQQIIPSYQEPINKLVDLLAKDFSLDSGALGYIKAYHTTAKRLKNAAMRLVNAGDQYSVLERERAVQALVLSEKAISRAEQISQNVIPAIHSLKQANAELVTVIKEQPYSTDSIKAYSQQIQELVNTYQVLTN